MKKLVLAIVVLVALIALAGLVLTLNGSLTGKWYEYGSQYGSMGQLPNQWNNKDWMTIEKQETLKSSGSVCCKQVALASNGYTSCPETKKEVERICGIPLDQQELETDFFGNPQEYFYPPCGPKTLECFIPVN